MHTKSTKTKTTDAIRILDGMMGDDPALQQLLTAARVNARVAQLLYDLRTQAGLSQAELARRAGSDFLELTPDVIPRP